MKLIEYENGRVEAVNDLQKHQYSLLLEMYAHIKCILEYRLKINLVNHNKLIECSKIYEDNRRELQRLTNEINLIRSLKISV